MARVTSEEDTRVACIDCQWSGYSVELLSDDRCPKCRTTETSIITLEPYLAKLQAELDNLRTGIELYRAKRMADGGQVETPNKRRAQSRPWDAIKHYHAEIAVDEWEQEQERRNG